jgi:hypothetical protein
MVRNPPGSPERAYFSGRTRTRGDIPGIVPISPLDVLDLQLIHRRANAYVLSTWTL